MDWFHDRWMISDCRGQKVRVDLTWLREGIDSWAEKHGGACPAKLDALLDRDALGHQYLSARRLPRDPWGREYVYLPGAPPNVLTFGRDGVPGGTRDDADVDFLSMSAEHR